MVGAFATASEETTLSLSVDDLAPHIDKSDDCRAGEAVVFFLFSLSTDPAVPSICEIFLLVDSISRKQIERVKRGKRNIDTIGENF